jgi:hypothetical protein
MFVYYIGNFIKGKEKKRSRKQMRSSNKYTHSNTHCLAIQYIQYVPTLSEVGEVNELIHYNRNKEGKE